MSVELLAPAGGSDSIAAAVRSGADAVYVGLKDFSARQSAKNFTAEELSEAVGYCHLHGVKLYAAMNTLLFDTQLDGFAKTAELAADMGVDAFIVQDLGGAAIIRQLIPDAPLHASTQMTIHTPYGAELAKRMGFRRVVLSRELSKERIAEICSVGIETEVFVHGALCMSVSGQCMMSAMIGSRSANRGRCAQACRLPCSDMSGEEYYALSLKDLSLIYHVDELRDIGVTSFKIEGRMKRPEYVAAAVGAFRRAIDGREFDTARLEAVFSRSGFTDGYFTGKTGSDMFGFRTKKDVSSAADVLPSIAAEYRMEKAEYTADFGVVLKEDKQSEITASVKLDNGEVITVSALGEPPQRALNRPATAEQIQAQLSKLGGTVFRLGNVTADIDDGVMLPASAINELRRSAVAALGERITAAHTPQYTKKELHSIPTNPERHRGGPKLRAFVYNTDLPENIFELADEVIIPLKSAEHFMKRFPDMLDRIILATPRFTLDEAMLSKKLSVLREAGFSRLYCGNISHIETADRYGFSVHAGFGLNCTNSRAAEELVSLGACDIEASPEMKLTQISHLSSSAPIGLVVYGRLPLMLVRNCPLKAKTGCKGCRHLLYDRKNKAMPVLCSDGCAEIFNADILYMSDKAAEYDFADFAVLYFHEETPDEISDILGDFRGRGKTLPSGFTRGLYYRGVE